MVSTIVGSAALEKIDRFAALLIEENANQNLIARGTVTEIWSRHLLDAAQLIAFARPGDRTWLDIGTGPGLPGIVLAATGRWAMTLVETRARRVDFLHQVVERCDLRDTKVVQADARKLRGTFDLITARAVASVADLLAIGAPLTNKMTRYILPKGRGAVSDVENAQRDWHGVFHVEQSITAPDSGIVLIDRATRK